MRLTTIATAAAAAAIVLSIAVVPGYSSLSSKAPYGSHLLDARKKAAPLPRRSSSWLRELRAIADDLEAGRSSPLALFALTALEGQRVSDLDRDSRIVIQHTALRIASALERRREDTEQTSSLERRASALVKRLALPRATLAAMSRAPVFAAEEWLGSQEEWIERTTQRCGNGPLIHERMFHGMLAFHPVRAGNRRALISQLIAIDDRGNPHITPIVESIELRLGMEVDAPVAVLELDLDSLGSGQTSLFAPAYEDLHETRFVRRDSGGGFSCTSECHQATDAWGARDILDSTEASELRANRSIKLLDFARRRISGLEL